MPSKAINAEQEPEKTHTWNCQRLLYQRKRSNLTHKQLAEAMGVSVKQIECMERCSRIPSSELLEMLVSFFDVPGDYFGVEALDGPIKVKPSQLSQQDERMQAAKARLLKQRKTLREMMKRAGFPMNCTGLRYLAEAIDEPIYDTCEFANGTLTMPPFVVQKTQAWVDQYKAV